MKCIIGITFTTACINIQALNCLHLPESISMLFKNITPVFFLCFVMLLMSTRTANALHATIIESQSFTTTDIMDIRWQTTLTTIGYTSTIVPQTTLNNTSFFASTDLLIISSGSIYLPPNRVNTILQFLQSGKPVYLQGEYNCSLSSNQAFSYFVNTLGGIFTWGGTTSDPAFQLNILGSFATTQLPIPGATLSSFNYGCHGSGCGIQYFLEYTGNFYGYFFCPPAPGIGSLIHVTDQDWIKDNLNDTLMKNIITHLTDPTLCSSTNFTPTNLGNDTTLCNGTAFTLNATNSNATYLWQNGTTNPTFNVTTAGTYWVQVTNNCGISSDTIHINYAPSPSINLGNDTMACAGHAVILNATTPGATYFWQDSSTNPVFIAIFSGIYSVTVSIGGCSAKDTIIVNFMPSPLLQIGGDTTLCEGQIIILNASTPNATYLWQDGSSASTFAVTQPGFYKVSVTTSCGTASDSITAIYKAAPDVNIGNDTSICAGSTIQLNAQTPNAIYLWKDHSIGSTFTVSNAGIYWVDVEVDNCVTRDSITINISENPVVNLGADVKLCKGDKLDINATTQNATYAWQDNSTNPTFTVTEKGNYWVLVNVGGCIGSDSIFVDYYPQSCNCNMYVPNAFSPNRDGINDEFKFIATEDNIELKEFLIFTRWGKLAFKSQSIFDSWNGNIKGEPAEMDTYYYQVKFTCKFTGEEHFMKGDVILIR